jgi:orotidine-5'-phosphate decarboxylase
MKDKIIVALDVSTAEAARASVEQLGGRVGWFKIGLQLFCAAGPSIVHEVKMTGSKVFLDLKFHDIPNTVRHAVESACTLGVDMLTIHLSGGQEMCQAAVTGRGVSPTLLMGVTVLTSQNDATLAQIGCRNRVSEQVHLLAELAKNCGVPGLIASPHEIAILREHFGSLFTVVTPGVRPAWADSGDQKRVMTPGEALQLGADYLVIGRPILAAKEPVAAVNRILEEIS